MSDGDDAKKAILARRAKFVAAAMAGLGASSCGKTKLEISEGTGNATYDASVPPMPCLSPPPIYDPPAPTPTPCLSAWTPPDDAGPPPRPCLSPPPPPPRPCLSIVKPGSCDPPFTIGADGRKRYKPECLE